MRGLYGLGGFSLARFKSRDFDSLLGPFFGGFEDWPRAGLGVTSR